MVKIGAYFKTRNTRTRNTGGTLVEHWRNTGGTPEHWRNNGTLASKNSGTREQPWNNGTTKQHQEVLPIQNDEILSR